jgi:hypothetical protein
MARLEKKAEYASFGGQYIQSSYSNIEAMRCNFSPRIGQVRGSALHLRYLSEVSGRGSLDRNFRLSELHHSSSYTTTAIAQHTLPKAPISTSAVY